MTTLEARNLGIRDFVVLRRTASSPLTHHQWRGICLNPGKPNPDNDGRTSQQPTPSCPVKPVSSPAVCSQAIFHPSATLSRADPETFVADDKNEAPTFSPSLAVLSMLNDEPTVGEYGYEFEWAIPAMDLGVFDLNDDKLEVIAGQESRSYHVYRVISRVKDNKERNETVLWWITLIVVIIFLLSGVSFLSSAYDFIGLRYRRVRAKSQLARFDDIMRRVGNGTITGTPLAPNEQVLRAVCKCNVVAASYRDFYRVSSMSPIAFECDATTASYNRMPATPIIHNSHTYEGSTM
ncbi:hypothetical protein ANCCEY_01773 [Ancylostoma ceylanicum]|uniref:Uncharacterized protein n=1 Tax=Ancylostoma ceylanicum TaxID=53326 RepID=A0A0D6M4Q5_9BILA|nr:hypothetical protein ANCCEY_01773 [Ancylostoma ceylanicum]